MGKLSWLLFLKNIALSTQKIKSLKEIIVIQEVKILVHSERYLTGIECEEVFNIRFNIIVCFIA